MFFDVKLENPDYRPVELDRFYKKNKSVENLIHKIISTSERIIPHYDKQFSRKGLSISLEKEARNGLVYNNILINKVKYKFLFFKSEEKFMVSNLLNEFFTDLHSRYPLTTPFNDVELINSDCVKAYMYATLILNNIVTDIGEECMRYREICSDYINLVGLLNIINNIGKVPLNNGTELKYVIDYLGIPRTHVKPMNGVIIKILSDYMTYSSPVIEIITCDRERTSVKGHLRLVYSNNLEYKLLRLLKDNVYGQVTLSSEVN